MGTFHSILPGSLTGAGAPDRGLRIEADVVMFFHQNVGDKTVRQPAMIPTLRLTVRTVIATSKHILLDN